MWTSFNFIMNKTVVKSKIQCDVISKSIIVKGYNKLPEKNKKIIKIKLEKEI